jgi:hypothetical protein
MPTREELRGQMIANAAEINRLHARVHEAVERRDEGDPLRQEWLQACEEFHRRYSELCLPGGWTDDLLDRLFAGDNDAIESVLCFLEVRPYFFRSGYHWKMFLKKCKRAPMNPEQAERYAEVARRYAEWKAFSRERSRRGAAIKTKLWPIVRNFYRLFPVRLDDYQFDGIATVGDLYRMLCGAMKVESEDPPDRPGGTARRPSKPIAPRHTDLVAWSREYAAWRAAKWPAVDIWATLVATIREACSVDDAVVIGPKTVLWPPESRQEHGNTPIPDRP